MTENTIEKIVELCKIKGIPVSRLEKDLGLGNGSLNPKKSNDIKSLRLFKILNYLGVSFEEFYGIPIEPLEETENPDTQKDDGNKKESLNDELIDYAISLFSQLPIDQKIQIVTELRALTPHTITQETHLEATRTDPLNS